MSGALEFVGVVAELVEAGLEVAANDDSAEPIEPPKQEAIEHFRDRPWHDEEPTRDTGQFRTQVPRA